MMSKRRGAVSSAVTVELPTATHNRPPEDERLLVIKERRVSASQVRESLRRDGATSGLHELAENS